MSDVPSGQLADVLVTGILFWAYATGILLAVLCLVCAYYWLEEHSNPLTDIRTGLYRRRATREIDALFAIPHDGEWPAWPSNRDEVA